MKELRIGWALFTGAFVGIVVFISEFFIPNSNVFNSVIVAGLSALIGGLIGNKIFPSRKER